MRRALVVAALLAGCYSPSPPSGGYLCSAAKQACPSGQRCLCGLCVAKETDAACGFRVSLEGAAPKEVEEHQSFPLVIEALAGDGAPATGFGGTVQLASSWGDVTPSEVTLKDGKTTAMVALNRETIAPQVARIKVTFHESNAGESPGISVKVPKLKVQPTEIMPTAVNPWGWARAFAAEPNVIFTGGQWRMYFIGADASRIGVGVATSADGTLYVPQAEPVLVQPEVALSPSAYQVGGEQLMAYGYTDGIRIAGSSDGLMQFTPLPGKPALGIGACGYCDGGVNFPQVFVEADGSHTMFFSAFDDKYLVSIGRAGSTDGKTWTPEPAPLLAGDLTGETVLLSPRVLRDGTGYKMWYSYSRLQIRGCTGTGQGTCPLGQVCVMNICRADADDPFAPFCEPDADVHVGYATSADGYFWTRSPSNPVIAVGVDTAPGTRAIIVSSAVPTDGEDPARGITIFYSSFSRAALFNNRCVPNGITRATRP